MIDIFNAIWPVIIAAVGLIVILAKMHGDIKVLKDQVRVLFEMFNRKK
jgi:hypothetical protein